MQGTTRNLQGKPRNEEAGAIITDHATFDKKPATRDMGFVASDLLTQRLIDTGLGHDFDVHDGTNCSRRTKSKAEGN